MLAGPGGDAEAALAHFSDAAADGKLKHSVSLMAEAGSRARPTRAFHLP